MAYDKTRMQDITIAEKGLWQQYYNYWANQDISSAINLLNNNPQLKYKVLNGFNWNRLINSVNDGTTWATEVNERINTDATTDSLVGEFASDYNTLINASEDFKYKGEWDSITAYKKNNLVKVGNYSSYFCIQPNTNQKPPNSEYWISAQIMLDPIGIQVATTPPTNLRVGDIYIQEITEGGA